MEKRIPLATVYRHQYYQDKKERLKVYRQKNKEQFNNYQSEKIKEGTIKSNYVRKGLRYDNTTVVR